MIIKPILGIRFFKETGNLKNSKITSSNKTLSSIQYIQEYIYVCQFR
jgi:hypothetical protein